MKSTEQNVRNLLANLIGGEGPAAVLFIEFAAKYGLPIMDGSVPLSTELNVMLQNWRIHLLDVTTAGFAGAIGFQRINTVACFGLWLYAPSGAKEGYINVGDSFPFVEVLSGASSQSAHSRTDVLSTRIRLDRNDYYCRAATRDKAVWMVVCETITRAVELAGQFEYLECDYSVLSNTKE